MTFYVFFNLNCISVVIIYGFLISLEV